MSTNTSCALFVLVLAGSSFAGSATADQKSKPAPSLPAAKPATGFEYEKIAKELATAFGFDASKKEDITYEDALTKNFVRGQFGAFDVRFPGSELEKRSEELKECVAAMLDAQKKWLDWVKVTGVDQKPVRDDLDSVAAWVKTWKPTTLAKLKVDGASDLYVQMAASEAVQESAKRLGVAMTNGSSLGAASEERHVSRIVLMPTRKMFSEFVFFAGWLDEAARASFWLENVPDWTQCFVAEDQVIALQYGIANRVAGDYWSGTGMNERDPNVLEQQVAQLATSSLLLAHYKDRVPSAFIGGLSMNLVIDLFKEVNTRVDGDTRSKVTNKREVFVPGGNSNGGFLPKNSAEGRWREDHGKDHFIELLHKAQKDAAKELKEAKNKAAIFALENDAASEHHVVTAPFMGSAGATATVPPEAYLGDYAEFLRAYKSGFIYFLQVAAAGNEKVSRERFATLLRKLADPNTTGDFEEVFKTVYDGATLSAPEMDKKSLEGQFVLWLAKQK